MRRKQWKRVDTFHSLTVWNIYTPLVRLHLAESVRRSKRICGTTARRCCCLSLWRCHPHCLRVRFDRFEPRYSRRCRGMCVFYCVGLCAILDGSMMCACVVCMHWSVSPPQYRGARRSSVVCYAVYVCLHCRTICWNTFALSCAKVVFSLFDSFVEFVRTIGDTAWKIKRVNTGYTEFRQNDAH